MSKNETLVCITGVMQLNLVTVQVIESSHYPSFRITVSWLQDCLTREYDEEGKFGDDDDSCTEWC